MFWKEAIRLDVIKCVSSRAAGLALTNQSPDPYHSYRSFSKKFPALLHQCGLLQALGTIENKSNSADWIEDFSKITIAALHRAAVVRAECTLHSLLAVLTDQEASRDVCVTGNTLYMHVHRVAMLVANHMKKEVATFMPKSKQDADGAVSGTHDEPLTSAANVGESTLQ